MRDFCAGASLLPTRARPGRGRHRLRGAPRAVPGLPRAGLHGAGPGLRPGRLARTCRRSSRCCRTSSRPRSSGRSTADTVKGLDGHRRATVSTGDSVRPTRPISGGTRAESRAAYLLRQPPTSLLLGTLRAPAAGVGGRRSACSAPTGSATARGSGRQLRPARWATRFLESSTANTALFTAIVTPVSMALGLGAPCCWTRCSRARGLFRPILILPMAVSGVATALIGVLVFDQNSGVLDKSAAASGCPAVLAVRAGPRPSSPSCSSRCGGGSASTCSSTSPDSRAIDAAAHEAAGSTAPAAGSGSGSSPCPASDRRRSSCSSSTSSTPSRSSTSSSS